MFERGDGYREISDQVAADHSVLGIIDGSGIYDLPGSRTRERKRSTARGDFTEVKAPTLILLGAALETSRLRLGVARPTYQTL